MKNNNILWIGIIILVLVLTFGIPKGDGMSVGGISGCSKETQDINKGTVNIYFTDKPIKPVKMIGTILKKTEAWNGSEWILIKEQDITIQLQKDTSQPIASEDIPEGTYTKLRFTHSMDIKLTFEDGTERQIVMKERIWEVPVMFIVTYDKTQMIMIDIPLEDSLEEINGEINFKPKNVKAERDLVIGRMKERMIGTEITDTELKQSFGDLRKTMWGLRQRMMI